MRVVFFFFLDFREVGGGIQEVDGVLITGYFGIFGRGNFRDEVIGLGYWSLAIYGSFKSCMMIFMAYVWSVKMIVYGGWSTCESRFC